MISYAADFDTRRISPARTLAIAVALVLHLAAFALLIAPVRPPAPDLAFDVPDIQIVMPERLIPPPPLPPVVPATPPRTTPVAERRTPAPVLIPNPEPAQTRDDVVQEIVPPTPDPVVDGAGDTGDAFTPAQIGSLSYLEAAAPRYPLAAIKRRLQGEVLLIVTVGPDGRPEAVDVQRSSGHAILDRAAIDQVQRRWRFRPLIVNGLPTRARGLVPIRFDLLDR